MLYLVATPIGNLADMTFRAIETLNACDYILCEDTRHTRPLLDHYEIQKPLFSFHKFNEKAKEDEVIHHLLEGKTIAIVSDAGTPGISDPGADLVQRCVQEGISVIPIPGACAAIAALTCSGLDTARFQFYGFLPKKEGELKHVLQHEILPYLGTTICYESPHRLLDVLALLHVLAPDRKVVVARELTKKFEELKHGTSQDLLQYWKDHPLKGEIVLLISKSSHTAPNYEQISPLEHVQFLEETYKLTRQEAIKLAAEMRGVPKREVYNALIKQPFTR